MAAGGTERWAERFRHELMLLFCCGGIYVCYMLYGYYQEKITSATFEGERFKYPMFMMLGQCIFNGVAALAILKVMGSDVLPGRPCNGRSLAFMFNLLAFTYLGGMLASYASLNWVNFPTVTLGKSCKMLPVMFVGWVFGKRYPLRSYVCMVLLAAGVSAYFLLRHSAKAKSLSDDGEDPLKSLIGMAFVLLSLACDGLTGFQEDEWRKMKHPPNSHQFMLGMNMWGAVQLFIVLFASGEGLAAWHFLQRHPEMWTMLFTFFVISAFGQTFIFLTITRFGSLTCSVVTTTRKFFTILASVVYFGHPQTTSQWIAVCVVFVALGWDIYGKYLDKKERERAAMTRSDGEESSSGKVKSH